MLSAGAITVTYVTRDRPATVTAAFGTKIVVEHGWSPADADILVVPGGGFRRRESAGV